MKQIFCVLINTMLLMPSFSEAREADLPAICSAATPALREHFNKKVEEFNDVVNSSKKTPLSSNPAFSCADISVINHGSATDGELYFYKRSTHELISICGMGIYISPDKNANCGKICPPMEWRANNCDASYARFLESQRLKH